MARVHDAMARTRAWRGGGGEVETTKHERDSRSRSTANAFGTGICRNAAVENDLHLKPWLQDNNNSRNSKSTTTNTHGPTIVREVPELVSIRPTPSTTLDPAPGRVFGAVQTAFPTPENVPVRNSGILLL
jgi:hypothetical protein